MKSIAWAENREDAFAVDADVYVTNIDGAKWLATKTKKFFAKFGQLVIDECTSVKHRTSGRSKAVKKIAQYFEWRCALSGTPTSNGICDLWHQVFVIDDGKRLGRRSTPSRKQHAPQRMTEGALSGSTNPASSLLLVV